MTEFNFLPWRAARREQIKRKFLRSVLWITSASALLTVLFSIAGQSRISIATEQQLELHAQVSELQAPLAKLKALQGAQRDAAAALIQLESLRNERQGLVAALQSIANAITPDAHLLRLERDDEILTLEGVAGGADLTRFMQRLTLEVGAPVALQDLHAHLDDSQRSSFVLLIGDAQESVP